MIHGQTYNAELDGPRLDRLLDRVKHFMLSGEWRTLGEISAACGGSEASVSARLRDLRNQYKYTIERKRIGEPGSGLFAYRLIYEVDKKGNGLLPGMSA